MSSRRNFNTSYSNPGGVPAGIFRAEVIEAAASSLKVRIPRLGSNGVYSDVPYYGIKPAVGDTIIVGLLEGNSSNPVAITPSPYGESAGGGGSSVGGANTQVQYNNSGVLAGSTNMTFDGTSLDVAGLKLANTAITSTAAELNILDGVTSTTAELNILDGVTSTTAELNILDGVTSTAAELNLLDGITAGTVSASLAVIVDSDKDITGFRNVTLTGELDAATLDISGDADIDGTTNLDVVDIDGAVDMASTLNVATSVGIGTTSPVGQLTVDSQNRQISIIDSGTVNYAEIRAHAVDSAASYANVNYNAYSHNFVIEGTRKLYIDNNGDILPDTDSDIDLGNSTRFFAKAYIDEATIGASIGPILKSGSGDALRIENDHGYIDIGPMNDGAEHIYASASTLFFGVSGNAEIRLTSSQLSPSSNEGTNLGSEDYTWNKFYLGQANTFSSGGYYTLRSRDEDRQVMELTSSERFKKDIVDLPLSEAYKILDARPIKYRGIDDDASVPLEVGLSAESLHNAGYEYAVRYDEGHWGTTPRSIYYEYLTAPLIAIIKDLKTRLEALES